MEVTPPPVSNRKHPPTRPGSLSSDGPVEYDREFLRPRYQLILSVLSVLVIIGLNVWFWFPYVTVTMWAVAVSQLIRPMAQDWANFFERMRHDVEIRRRWSLQCLLRELHNQATILNKDSYLSFVFIYPALSLSVMLLIHLISLSYVLVLFFTLFLIFSFVSVLFDLTGLSLKVLRAIAKPEWASTLIIASLLGLVVFMHVALLIGSTFELADLASETSSMFTQMFAEMSKGSSPVMEVLPSHQLGGYVDQAFLWLKSKYQDYEWFPALEGMRTSFRLGESADDMAERMLRELRTAYNDTNYLWLMETTLKAVVPKHHHHAETSKHFVAWLFSGLTLVSFLEKSNMFVVSLGNLVRDLVQSFLGLFGQFLLFLFILQKLCGSEREFVSSLCLLLVPTGRKGRKRFSEDLKLSLAKAITEPAFEATMSALVLSLSFYVLGQPYSLIPTLLVYVLTLFHLVSADSSGLVLISLPWVLVPFLKALLLANGWDLWEIAGALLLPVVLNKLSSTAKNSLQSRLSHVGNNDSSSSSLVMAPWMVHAAAALGVSNFGMNGLLFGPFLVAVTVVSLEFQLLLQEQDAEIEDHEIVKKWRDLQEKENIPHSNGNSAVMSTPLRSQSPTLVPGSNASSTTGAEKRMVRKKVLV